MNHDIISFLILVSSYGFWFILTITDNKIARWFDFKRDPVNF